MVSPTGLRAVFASEVYHRCRPCSNLTGRPATLSICGSPSWQPSRHRPATASVPEAIVSRGMDTYLFAPKDRFRRSATARFELSLIETRNCPPSVFASICSDRHNTQGWIERPKIIRVGGDDLLTGPASADDNVGIHNIRRPAGGK
jgi:hypothetical protein